MVRQARRSHPSRPWPAIPKPENLRSASIRGAHKRGGDRTRIAPNHAQRGAGTPRGRRGHGQRGGREKENHFFHSPCQCGLTCICLETDYKRPDFSSHVEKRCNLSVRYRSARSSCAASSARWSTAESRSARPPASPRRATPRAVSAPSSDPSPDPGPPRCG